jgi:hypothetical protein
MTASRIVSSSASGEVTGVASFFGLRKRPQVPGSRLTRTKR